MISYLISLIVSAIAVIITAFILPGVTVKGFGPAFLAAFLIGIVNAFIKPVMVILTWPITIITFGLFLFVINALMVLLVSAIVKGFQVKGIGWAIVFSIVLSLVNSVLNWMF